MTSLFAAPTMVIVAGLRIVRVEARVRLDIHGRVEAGPEDNDLVLRGECLPAAAIGRLSLRGRDRLKIRQACWKRQVKSSWPFQSQSIRTAAAVDLVARTEGGRRGDNHVVPHFASNRVHALREIEGRTLNGRLQGRYVRDQG